MPKRTTARTAADIPAESPPLVMIATRFDLTSCEGAEGIFTLKTGLRELARVMSIMNR